MTKIALIYASDTGNTESVAQRIRERIGRIWERPPTVEVYDLFYTHLSGFEGDHDFLILGISTWYDGQMQADWDSLSEDLTEEHIRGRPVAVFGLGDQEDWGDYYCDGLGTLAELVLKLGGKLIGRWPVEGYEFALSRAVAPDGRFYGLALDEDRQAELTDNRLETWLRQIEREYRTLVERNAA